MKPRNVLLILSDQHRADAAGCYGHPVARTPHLDRLAAEGVVFDRAYCSNPLCVPSRVSLLTGRYSATTGVYSLGAALRDDVPTFAHLFAAAGYETVLAGRMHLVWSDRLHGYERRFNPEPYKGPFNCREYWRDPLAEYDFRAAFASAGAGESRHLVYDRAAHAAALEFLRSPRASERPWMLTSCFIIPHEPYQAPQEFFSLYDTPDLPVPPPHDPARPQVEEMYRSFDRYKGFHNWSPPPETIRKAVAAYYGLVTCMDSMIGELLRALEETGQLENTLVLYTSDHGEMLGEKGCWHKSYLYDASARVPLIVREPGRVPAGLRVRAPVSQVDLFPTMAEWLGTEIKPDLRIDGRSLLPLIEGRPAPELERRGVLVEYADYGVRTPMAAWVKDSHKLTCAPGFPSVLVDLDRDPDERCSLIDTPAAQPLRRGMERELAAAWDPDAVRRTALDCQYGLTLIEAAWKRQGRM